MARCGRTNLAGGGGVGSDETTATKDKVLKDYTYLGADTDDEIGTGTIESMKGTTVTPSASQQTVSTSGKYLTGDVIVSAVANLTAANIANGKVVGGTTGTYKGLGNATAAQVLAGKTFSTASLSNTAGTMTNYSGYTSTSNYTSGTFKSGTTGYIFVVPGGTGYYSNATYLRIPATNLAAANIKKGVKILGITGSFEGYTSTPTYLLNGSDTWSNLQTTGTTCTGYPSGLDNADYNSKGSSRNEGKSWIWLGVQDPATTALSGTIICRLNQTVNLSSYNYVKWNANISIWARANTTLYLGVSTSSNVSATSGLSSVYSESFNFNDSDGAESLGGSTFISNVSSLTGNYYIYFALTFSNVKTTTTISAGGSKLWLANN